MVPEQYLEEVRRELLHEYTDSFGGPDRSHGSFSNMQKAIDYSMTSILTTGGIRGRAKGADRFYPRSFNMGISRSAFEALGGFADMRFGEDIDLSYRVIENGYTSRLFPNAWVYHKRRNNFRTFYKQVFHSGRARIHLSKQHAGSLKMVHLLPAVFTIGCLLSVLISPFYFWALLPLVLFSILLFIHSLWSTQQIQVAILSIVSSFVQLIGYGTGFLTGWWKH